ncbi:MAG: hypothetical protein J6W04_04330 [Bacteroidales bacterium]|nr:hypothetical protein [Bacteroidales bacterium]
MEYLTYDEYLNYGGTLDETAFSRLGYMAKRKIDRKTFNRLVDATEIGEPVKRLMFELIGVINKTDTSNESYEPAIASEGNDGYSISYASASIMTPDSAEKKIDSLIEEYLQLEKAPNGQYLLSCGLGTLR